MDKIEEIIICFLKREKKIGIKNLGFLTLETLPAEIVKDTVYPPKLTCFFHPEKQEETDVFIKHVSLRMSIPIIKAEELLYDFSVRVKEICEEGKMFELPDMGYFIFDKEKKINFILYEETCSLTSNYGLPKLNIPTQASKDKKGNRVSLQKKTSIKFYKRIAKNVFIIGLITTLVILFFMKLDFNFTTSKTENEPKKTITNRVNNDSLSSINNENSMDSSHFFVEQDIPQSNEKEEPLLEQEIISEETDRYYLIIASFSSIEKAQVEKEKIEKNGDKKLKIIYNNGKARLSIADFSSRKASQSQFDLYKKSFPDIWRLKF